MPEEAKLDVNIVGDLAAARQDSSGDIISAGTVGDAGTYGINAWLEGQ